MTAAELPYTHETDNFIDGVWQRANSPRRIDVTNPATENVWASVPDSDDTDLDGAVSAARAALARPGWRDLPPTRRAELVLAFAEAIERRATPLSHTNTAENGSPISETSRAADNAASILRYFASLAVELERDDVRPFPDGGAETHVRWDPVGVCALIAPWNFPINLVVIKLAPALIAGCTVVIKPASPTPLSIRFIADAASEAGIPAGVINVITGSGALGDRLVRHPGIDKVAFTGSTPVGRRIAAACGELLRPVTLELGGKSSAIVLDDADLDEMAKVLIRTSLRNTGQTCYISTRILAPSSRYEEVVTMAAETVAAQRQGDPMDAATIFGPSATRSQYRTVLDYLASARDEGARTVIGGGPADLPRGFYVAPTVLADVTPSMRVAREEVFGPVLTILSYDSDEEAVSIANDTDFGLGGTVFSADPYRAQSIASRVDTGSIGINFFASNHAAPFGGRRDSGLGLEYGMEGLRAYLSPKSVHRRR
ncbi:aldehyde dehydrogenase family protein [Pseudolysinimonas sp.]